MPFSDAIKERAMVACGRRCCLCHKFCGNNMEVHHIKAHSDGGTDDYENAIPLCFDCHAEVRQYDPRHPKGIRFSEKELIEHRNSWYSMVKSGTPFVQETEMQKEQRPLKIYRQKGYQDILLQKVSTGKELLHFVIGADGLLFDHDEPKTKEEATLISDFISQMHELMDYDDFLDPGGRVTLGFELNDELKKLEDASFWVFCAVEKRKMVGGAVQEMDFPVVMLRIIRTDNPEIIRVAEES